MRERESAESMDYLFPSPCQPEHRFHLDFSLSRFAHYLFPLLLFFSTGSSPLTFHTLVTLFAENPRLQEKSLSTFSNKDYLPSIVWPQG